MAPAPRQAAWRPRLALALVGALAVATACTSTEPASVDQPVESSTAAAGLTADIEEWLGNLYSPGARHVRAVVVSVDGEIVAERYWDSTATTTNDTFSVTKSITGILAGIALADGSLRDVDQPLPEMLPTYASDMTPTVASITLRQLLSMTAGLPADDLSRGPPDWLFSDDWVGSIIDHGPDHSPGGSFSYSSVTSHLLGAAVDEATPGSLLDYARENLFGPLGIDTRPALEPPMTDDPAVLKAYDRAGFAWPVDPQGRHVGYAYIKLTARDMLKIGQLYLDRGRWEGRQVVPAAWVRESTRSQATARVGDLDGYGYHWWTGEADGHHAFVALGFGGQLIEVVPDLGLVVAASTKVVEDRTPLESTMMVTLVRDVVVPHVE